MKKRMAFSLLELMIALVLLGVLSALAWSILDNFRSAEQRGWKVASRLQSIRSARLWLEEDLLHVCETLPRNGTLDSTRVPPISFQGSATGFSITYSPSIDPLPWLEELVLHSQDSTVDETAAINRYTRLGLYTVEAKYQLQSGGSLIRTITSQAPLAPPATSSSLTSDSEPVEPTLTVNDLYRQSDTIDEIGGAAANSNQSKLGPIYRPRFRYHNGTTWKSNWVSSPSASIPTAIELSFDLDRSASTLPEDVSSESTSDDPLSEGPLSEGPLSELPDPLAEVEVPVVELDDDVSEAMLQEPRQIRLVVRLPWVNVASRGETSSSENVLDDESFSESSSSSSMEEFNE